MEIYHHSWTLLNLVSKLPRFQKLVLSGSLFAIKIFINICNLGNRPFIDSMEMQLRFCDNFPNRFSKLSFQTLIQDSHQSPKSFQNPIEKLKISNKKLFYFSNKFPTINILF
jgi:hypothetical protein